MVKNGIIILLGLFVLAQFILYRYLEIKREKQIKEIIDYLMVVQDSLELPDINVMAEGQLSILQSEIYKVVVLLREAYSKEADGKRYMADMLSDISHQIKTPISAISIMADLLEAPECSEEQRLLYADKIDRQAKRINWLIRNLLNLAQLEAEVLKLKNERTDMADILKSVSESLEIMAEVKGVELSYKLDESVFIYCDDHWLTEAILNITKNCIEHTDKGGTVKINVSQDNIATHIRISDNGQGISEEHLPHIFKRFYKGDNSSPNSYGIGLSLAKQIILRQNGVISVTSKISEGTEFYIKLFKMETV